MPASCWRQRPAWKWQPRCQDGEGSPVRRSQGRVDACGPRMTAAESASGAGRCRLHKRPRRTMQFAATTLALVALALAAVGADESPGTGLAPPLDPPLRITATFGEYRGGHFHMGIDLSTDETVGKPVYAPMSGDIVRVRSSAVGSGRPIYLKAP